MPLANKRARADCAADANCIRAFPSCREQFAALNPSCIRPTSRSEPTFVVRYQNGDENSYAMIVFEAEILAGEARPDEDEILEVRFFAPSELGGVEMPVWMAEVMQDALDGGERVSFRRPTWRPPATA